MNQEAVFKKRKKKIPENLVELHERIKEEMIKHIGVENEITKMELFKAIFGNPDGWDEIQQFYLWDRMKKAMNNLRKSSNCFIASRQSVPGIWAFFVVSNHTDFTYYKNNLQNNIQKMYTMIDKGQKYVNKKGHKKFIEEMEK